MAVKLDWHTSEVGRSEEEVLYFGVARKDLHRRPPGYEFDFARPLTSNPSATARITVGAEGDVPVGRSDARSFAENRNSLPRGVTSRSSQAGI